MTATKAKAASRLQLRVALLVLILLLIFVLIFALIFVLTASQLKPSPRTTAGGLS
jgi:type VI protein secretion system component VasF